MPWITPQRRLGKNIGDDLDEGKPTLPLIHAIAVGTPEQRALTRGHRERRPRADR